MCIEYKAFRLSVAVFAGFLPLLLAGAAGALEGSGSVLSGKSSKISTVLKPEGEKVSSRKLTDGKYAPGSGLGEGQKLEEEIADGPVVEELPVFIEEGDLDEYGNKIKKKKKRIN